MSFNGYKPMAGRDIPRVLIAVFLLVLFFGEYAGLNVTDVVNRILVGLTAIYAFFTYELLRITRHNKALPYIKIDLVVASNLSGDFFEQFSPFVEKTPEYQVLLDEDGEGDDEVKNFIFLKIENIGESLAVGVEVELSSKVKNFLQENDLDASNMVFHDLKPGEVSLKLIEVYERPSRSDFYKLQKAGLRLSDSSYLNTGTKPMERDVTKNIGIHQEEGALVNIEVKK